MKSKNCHHDALNVGLSHFAPLLLAQLHLFERKGNDNIMGPNASDEFICVCYRHHTRSK
ncbi:hypothetical protein THOD03_130097 [Vibrio harveyi]|nr:hypothetical protein TH15OA1_250052 [Vibrio harveyi]CAH1549918.1 hypothetical protein THOD03_130097 [Vibrio harveyi]